MNIEPNAIDQILDPENNDNVVVYNENNIGLEFEQIFVMPYKSKDYAILKPVIPIEGVGEDEGLVFEIMQDHLTLVTDDKTIDLVFDRYEKKFEEDNLEEDEEDND